jgi:pimeloyl-ACP methyl ester carboxylesterase
MMKAHSVTGGGGVRLHVVETGNPQGRPILFIHGASQCWLQWDRQMNSSLADEHRLTGSCGRTMSTRSSSRSTWIIQYSVDGPTVRLFSWTTSGTTARTGSAACN